MKVFHLITCLEPVVLMLGARLTLCVLPTPAPAAWTASHLIQWQC